MSTISATPIPTTVSSISPVAFSFAIPGGTYTSANFVATSASRLDRGTFTFTNGSSLIFAMYGGAATNSGDVLGAVNAAAGGTLVCTFTGYNLDVPETISYFSIILTGVGMVTKDIIITAAGAGASTLQYSQMDLKWIAVATALGALNNTETKASICNYGQTYNSIVAPQIVITGGWNGATFSPVASYGGGSPTVAVLTQNTGQGTMITLDPSLSLIQAAQYNNTGIYVYQNSLSNANATNSLTIQAYDPNPLVTYPGATGATSVTSTLKGGTSTPLALTLIQGGMTLQGGAISGNTNVAVLNLNSASFTVSSAYASTSALPVITLASAFASTGTQTINIPSNATQYGLTVAVAQAQGDIYYCSTTGNNALVALSKVAASNGGVLAFNQTTTAPAWVTTGAARLVLTSTGSGSYLPSFNTVDVSGVNTSLSGITQYGVFYGASTSTVGFLTGTTGYFLMANTSGNPTFSNSTSANYTFSGTLTLGPSSLMTIGTSGGSGFIVQASSASTNGISVVNTPIAPTDAVNKAYADLALQGLNAKDSVRLCTSGQTGNVPTDLSGILAATNYYLQGASLPTAANVVYNTTPTNGQYASFDADWPFVNPGTGYIPNGILVTTNTQAGAPVYGAAPSTTVTIDGVSMKFGDRMLVKDFSASTSMTSTQSTNFQSGSFFAEMNGIYTLGATYNGSVYTIVFLRTVDANTIADVAEGSYVFIEEGTANAASGWVETNKVTALNGATSASNITCTQFAGVGEYTFMNVSLNRSGTSVAGNLDLSSANNSIYVGGGVSGAISASSSSAIPTGTSSWYGVKLALTSTQTGTNTVAPGNLTFAGLASGFTLTGGNTAQSLTLNGGTANTLNFNCTQTGTAVVNISSALALTLSGTQAYTLTSQAATSAPVVTVGGSLTIAGATSGSMGLITLSTATSGAYAMTITNNGTGGATTLTLNNTSAITLVSTTASTLTLNNSLTTSGTGTITLTGNGQTMALTNTGAAGAVTFNHKTSGTIDLQTGTLSLTTLGANTLALNTASAYGVTVNIFNSATTNNQWPLSVGNTSVTYPTITNYSVVLAPSTFTNVSLAAPDGTTGKPLVTTGSGNAPAFGNVNVGSYITGTLPILNGGTNNTTYTDKVFLYYDNTAGKIQSANATSAPNRYVYWNNTNGQWFLGPNNKTPDANTVFHIQNDATAGTSYTTVNYGIRISSEAATTATNVIASSPAMGIYGSLWDTGSAGNTWQRWRIDARGTSGSAAANTYVAELDISGEVTANATSNDNASALMYPRFGFASTINGGIASPTYTQILKIYGASATPTYWAGIQAPVLSANYTWILPSATPAANQVLTVGSVSGTSYTLSYQTAPLGSAYQTLDWETTAASNTAAAHAMTQRSTFALIHSALGTANAPFAITDNSGASALRTEATFYDASATVNGFVNISAQSFAGVKTFTSGLTVSSAQPVTLTGFTTNNVLYTGASAVVSNSNNFAWASNILSLTNPGINSTPTSALNLVNGTAAIVGQNQIAPMLYMTGQGWTGSVTTNVDWGISETMPNGATASDIGFYNKIGAAALTKMVSVGSDYTLRFFNGSNAFYAAFKASTTAASSVTWTLPVADSTGTQALVSNGSAVLSWATMSSTLELNSGGGGASSSNVYNYQNNAVATTNLVYSPTVAVALSSTNTPFMASGTGSTATVTFTDASYTAAGLVSFNSTVASPQDFGGVKRHRKDAVTLVFTGAASNANDLLLLTNTSAATGTATMAFSPNFVFNGANWSTGGTPQSNAIKAAWQFQPITTAAVNTGMGQMALGFDISAANTYTQQFAVTNFGVMVLNGSATSPGTANYPVLAAGQLWFTGNTALAATVNINGTPNLTNVMLTNSTTLTAGQIPVVYNAAGSQQVHVYNANLYFDLTSGRLGLSGVSGTPVASLSFASATTLAGGIAFGVDTPGTNLYRITTSSMATDALSLTINNTSNASGSTLVFKADGGLQVKPSNHMQLYAYNGIDVYGALGNSTPPTFNAGSGTTDPVLTVYGNGTNYGIAVSDGTRAIYRVDTTTANQALILGWQGGIASGTVGAVPLAIASYIAMGNGTVAAGTVVKIDTANSGGVVPITNSDAINNPEYVIGVTLAQAITTSANATVSVVQAGKCTVKVETYTATIAVGDFVILSSNATYPAYATGGGTARPSLGNFVLGRAMTAASTSNTTTTIVIVYEPLQRTTVGVVTATTNGTSYKIPVWDASSAGTSTTALANAVIYQDSSSAHSAPNTIGISTDGSTTAANQVLQITNLNTATPTNTVQGQVAVQSLSMGTFGGSVPLNDTRTSALVIKTCAAQQVATVAVFAVAPASGTSAVMSVDGLGNLRATTKSFVIPFPGKSGKRLVYGVLEGPEHGVYHRGEISGRGTMRVELPEYWALLAHEGYTIQVTSRGNYGVYIVDKDASGFTVRRTGILGKWLPVKFEYYVVGSRRDATLIIEEDEMAQVDGDNG